MATTATPVVGVFAWPAHFLNPQKYDFIASSYPKWLEVGGVRSIAIPSDATVAELDTIFGQIHGLLIPGGSGGMGPSVTHLLRKAILHNRKGHFFPVWGTCLGFEYLIRHVARCTGTLPSPTVSSSCPIKHNFDSENISLPLEQVVPWQLYQDPFIHDIVRHQNVTMNNHHLGLPIEEFYSNSRLTQLWRATSTNCDRKGR